MPTTHTSDADHHPVRTFSKNQPTHSLAALPTAMALDLPALGQLVRERRLAARLTQAKLAKLTGLTEVTIRNVEYAHNPPSEDTLRRLLEVQQLKLSAGDLPTLRHSDMENDLEFFRKLNWYIAPDYEVLELWLKFRQQLNSDAGHIEQTYLYLDAESAADYMRMASSYEYEGAIRENMPLPEIAQVAVNKIPNHYVDVIALGPGDGQQETRMVQHLMMLRPDLLLKFYLLDISQPLLNVAYRHAAESLGEYQNVFIAGMQGNFYNLPYYGHIFYAPKSRPTSRVFLMIGGTINNIDNEIRFFRHTLAIASAGDLLILTLQQAYTDELNESAIRKTDPAIGKPLPMLHAKWLGGPIRRYCEDVTDIQFKSEVRLDCIVPGSYAIDSVARVHFKNGHSRSISMCRFKRYDSSKFAECLKAEGWELLDNQPSAMPDEKSKVICLMLFRKVAAPPSAAEEFEPSAPL